MFGFYSRGLGPYVGFLSAGATPHTFTAVSRSVVVIVLIIVLIIGPIEV